MKNIKVNCGNIEISNQNRMNEQTVQELKDSASSEKKKLDQEVEELRDDLVRMERLQKNPEEFGLKVRESPTGISITAANKMRTAKPIRLAADYNEKHIQAYEFFNKAKTNKNHLTVVENFHEQLMTNYSDSYQEVGGALIWKNVNAVEIAELVRQFDLPQTEFIKMSGGDILCKFHKRVGPNK